MKDIQKIKEFFSKPLNEGNKALYIDWDQFEKPSKIKVYLNNGKTLEISPLRLKGGKRVYDAILQAFIDDRFDITNKVVQAMTNNSSEAEEEETAVDMAKKQLDALGVEYEMSGNKFIPFKAIYRPKNESDEFYGKFNRIVYEFNLESAVKQKMSEAKFRSGLLSGKDFINAKLSKYPKAVSKINQLIDMIGEDKFTIEMAEWVFDFFNNASYESPVNEATKDEETKFHKKLDTLVHNTFGKRKGEMEEGFYGRGDKRRGLQNQSKLSSAEYQMAKKLKSFKASDWKWNADEDLYNKVTEATDYMKRRKAQDDYAVSKKDKPKKSSNPNPPGKTDYMKRREKELAEAILAKLKK